MTTRADDRPSPLVSAFMSATRAAAERLPQDARDQRA
jgi:hypothetical protein